LGNVRLVELGSFVAGPYSARLLADFGADVVKVEPLTGDPIRGVFRTSYVANRGKRSISVDAKSPEGAEILNRLCASADAVSHNLRPLAAKRLGIDFETLARAHPGIVVLATTSYGETGPKAHLPGFDYVMQAYGGHEVRAGGDGQPPLWYRSPIVDYAAGALGAIGLIEGLRQGGKQSVKAEVNLLSTSVFLMSELVQQPDGTSLGAPFNDSQQLGFHPAERLYRCKDGWIAIAARSNAMAHDLISALEIDPVLLGRRSDWGRDAAERIAAAFLNRTCEDALNLMSKAEVWSERCCEDGWSAANALPSGEDAPVITQADRHYGDVTSLAPHVRLSRTGFREMGGCPLVGEHTREILTALGYSTAEIEDLHLRRIVRSPAPSQGSRG
jgi:crotonobetainyl-CoA:carnitine CoA-transferase CaiB-like acyl-CoA transferase